MKLSKAEKMRRHKRTKGYLHKQEKKEKKKEIINKDKQWRKDILYRDNFTCQLCKSKDIRLNAHHILPKHFCKGELEFLRWDLMNGICLCAKCHHWGDDGPHNNALYFSAWLHEHRFNQWDYLIEYVNVPPNHVKPIQIK